MPRHASLADQYRAHRAEMELVLATGCTPLEARQELRRLARARRDACGRHASDAPADNETNADQALHPVTFEAWDADWMMRN